jgi:hypothetical protein
MGRTLHYSIIKEKGSFSDAEKQSMIDISEKYNSGPLREIWSCENYYFTPFDHYPDWEGMFRNTGQDEAWNKIGVKWKELAAQGKNDIAIYEELHSAGYIVFSTDPKSNKFGSFTKVQGNELNALLVYQALLELSTVIPDSIIHLSDEGRFLYCDVSIKNGKARPLLSDIKKMLRYYFTLLKTKDKKLISKINKYDLPKGILNDMHLGDNSYSEKDVMGWINQKMLDLNEVYNKIKQDIPASFHCIFNIEQLWYDPFLLCRPVRKEDFEEVNCDAGTLMAGVYGEYWKLTNKDPESESYKSIARLQKILGITEDSEKKLEILSKPKKKKD